MEALGRAGRQRRGRPQAPVRRCARGQEQFPGPLHRRGGLRRRRHNAEQRRGPRGIPARAPPPGGANQLPMLPSNSILDAAATMVMRLQKLQKAALHIISGVLNTLRTLAQDVRGRRDITTAKAAAAATPRPSSSQPVRVSRGGSPPLPQVWFYCVFPLPYVCLNCCSVWSIAVRTHFQPILSHLICQ